MRYILLFVLSLVIASACTTPAQPVSKDEVTSLLDRWLELWSSYDLNKLPDIFWDDPSMTYFSSEKEGLIKGYDQMKPHHEGFGFITGGKPAAKSLWLEDQNITLHDNSAVVEAIWYFGDQTLPKDSAQQGPVTFVIVRNDDGDLRIAHTHFSNYQ